jgi:hypothetical protein
MKRGKPLRRKTALRRVNHARLRARRARCFAEQSALARTMPCWTCGAPPPSDPSHLKTRGADGLDEHVIPQCRRCHRALHSEGIHSFFVKRGLDRHQLLDRMRALMALNTNTAWTTEAEGQTA